jgi:hypothetical protein
MNDKQRIGLTLSAMAAAAVGALQKIGDLHVAVQGGEWTLEYLNRSFEDHPNLMATAAIGTGCAVCGVIFRWLRRRRSTDVGQVVRPRIESTLTTIRPARTSAEVREASNISNFDGYPGLVSVEGAIRWWYAHRPGQWLALRNGQVVAAVDIWPIKPGRFTQIAGGKLHESAIQGERDIALPANGARGSWYYAGSLCVRRGMRQREAAAVILRILMNMVESVASECPGFPARFVAIQATEAGRNLLDSLDFTQSVPPEIAAIGHGIFRRDFRSSEDFMALIFQLQSRLRRIAPTAPEVSWTRESVLMERQRIKGKTSSTAQGAA